MSLTMQEIISQMAAENVKRREHFNNCFKIYDDNPRSFGHMQQIEIAILTTEMRHAKQYMREQENLLEHIKIAFANIQLTQISSVV
jgi:hypothetical protein